MSFFTALSALYASTNGTGWQSKANWLTGHPCTNEWYGVSCDFMPASYEASSLNLRRNGLAGRLPSELGQLTALGGYLYLFGNALTGPIPSEIGQLTAFGRALYLSENALTGAIPSEIGQLTAMRMDLELDSNRLTGALPSELGRLTGLSNWLDLYGNRLSGPLPSELGALTAMTSDLALDRNRFSGSLPSQLGRLTAMAWGAYLYDNRLSGALPSELGAWTVMGSGLFADNNRFSGVVPSELGSLTAMSWGFGFSDNDLSGPVPSELGRLTRMGVYSLSYSHDASFSLEDNGSLCGVLPAQVAALAALSIARGNPRLGSPCPAPPSLTAAPPTSVPAPRGGDRGGSGRGPSGAIIALGVAGGLLALVAVELVHHWQRRSLQAKKRYSSSDEEGDIQGSPLPSEEAFSKAKASPALV